MQLLASFSDLYGGLFALAVTCWLSERRTADPRRCSFFFFFFFIVLWIATSLESTMTDDYTAPKCCISGRPRSILLANGGDNRCVVS